MIKDIIKYNEKEYQLSTINLDGCFETMIFPIKKGIVSGEEVFMCRIYNAGQSYDLHKDIYNHQEKYLSNEAIADYLKSKEEGFITNGSIWVVSGYINESGDESTWIEELFEDKEQAEACCKFLNLTKSQENVEYNVYEHGPLCEEDYIAKLKYFNK